MPTMIPLQFNPIDTMVLVFKLPRYIPEAFLFGGGLEVTFILIDWFNADPDSDAFPLEQHIRKRPYFKPDENFLIMRRNGAAFVVHS